MVILSGVKDLTVAAIGTLGGLCAPSAFERSLTFVRDDIAKTRRPAKATSGQ